MAHESEGFIIRTVSNKAAIGSRGDSENYPAFTQKGAQDFIDYWRQHGDAELLKGAKVARIGKVRFVTDFIPPEEKQAQTDS